MSVRAAALSATVSVCALLAFPAQAGGKFQVVGHGPVPAAIRSAGADLAWAAQYTAGPRVTSWTAASSITGANIVKGAYDFEITGGSLTLNAPDFSGFNVWPYNGAVVVLNDPKLYCNGVPGACNQGDMIRMGQDAGANPHGAATLTINYGDVDGAGRSPGIQHSLYQDLASILTANHTRFRNGTLDYIQTSGDAELYLNEDYFTAWGTDIRLNGDPLDPAHDHGEGTHFYGKRIEIRNTLIDSRRGRSIVAGYTSEVYFDPASGTAQTAIVDRSAILNDGAKLYTLALGGLGTVDFTISNTVLKRGTSGYVSGFAAGGVTFHDGHNNRDFDTNALLCGIEGFDPCPTP